MSSGRPAQAYGPPRSGRILAGVAVMLVLFAVVILGGVYYMLTRFGDELDSELDSQVRTVQRDSTATCAGSSATSTATCAGSSAT